MGWWIVKLTIVGVYEVVFKGWRIVVFVTVAFSRCAMGVISAGSRIR